VTFIAVATPFAARVRDPVVPAPASTRVSVFIAMVTTPALVSLMNVIAVPIGYATEAFAAIVNVRAVVSAEGWYTCFPPSASTVVYAALCEFCGIFLNHTLSVPSAVQLSRFPLAGVPRAPPLYTKFQSVHAVSNCAIVPDTVLLPNAIVLFVNVVVRESIHVFRNAFRFVNVSVFSAFQAALSKIENPSASTGVVFPVAVNIFVPILASVSSPAFVPEVFASFVFSASVTYLLSAESAISAVVASAPAVTSPFASYVIFVFVAPVIAPFFCTNNPVAQSYTAFAVRYKVFDASFPVIIVALFAEFSGVNPIFVSAIAQFVEVCHGVSTIARTRSPGVTETPPSVPATDTVQRSHFSIAPAVPDPHEAGNVLTEAL